jgi:hypothetical protein
MNANTIKVLVTYKIETTQAGLDRLLSRQGVLNVKTDKIAENHFVGTYQKITELEVTELNAEKKKAEFISGLTFSDSYVKHEFITEAKPEAKPEAKQQDKKTLSLTRDELLYEMDANGLDEITLLETSGSLGKTKTTYKRSDLGEFSKKFILDDGSVNKREMQLYLEKFCANLTSSEELKKRLTIEAKKMIGSKVNEVNGIIDLLVDMSIR